MSLKIRKIQSDNEIHECANLMSNSEPWVTLGRTYKESIFLLQDIHFLSSMSAIFLSRTIPFK